MLCFLPLIVLSSLLVVESFHTFSGRYGRHVVSTNIPMYGKRNPTDIEALKTAAPTKKGATGTPTKSSKKGEKPVSTGTRKSVGKAPLVSPKDILAELLTEIAALEGDDASDLDLNLDSIVSKKSDKLQQDQEKQTKLLNSVIRVHCTHSAPNYNMYE